MPAKLLVVPSHSGAQNLCAYCSRQTIRLPGFSLTTPGGYFGLVCNCGHGREMREVYPELKTPGYSLDFYLALISQLERMPFFAAAPSLPLPQSPGEPSMSPENFCYWLQGRAELVAGAPSEAEWDSIVAHLALVFKKVTPYPEHWPQPLTPGPARPSPGVIIC